MNYNISKINNILKLIYRYKFFELKNKKNLLKSNLLLFIINFVIDNLFI